MDQQYTHDPLKRKQYTACDASGGVAHVMEIFGIIAGHLNTPAGAMISLESRSLDDLPTSEIMSLYARVDSELLRVRQFTKDYTELARLTQEFDALEAILEQRIRNGE